MRHRRVSVALIAAIVTTTGLLPFQVASTVDATASCGDTNVVSRFAGFVTVTTQYGVEADLVDRPISLCSNVNGASSGASAWGMLAGGGPNEYAQVGFAKTAGMAGAMRFTEYNDGSSTAPGWNRTWWSGFSAGTTHTYNVAYSFSTGKVSASSDGQSLFTTPWAADGGTGQPGYTGQFLGETWDRGDDVPGTSTAKSNFRNVTARSCRGCSYVGVNGTAGSDLAAHKQNWITKTTAFDIWTQRRLT